MATQVPQDKLVFNINDVYMWMLGANSDETAITTVAHTVHQVLESRKGLTRATRLSIEKLHLQIQPTPHETQSQ